MGQTVNLLAFAFGGSNPSAPTTSLRGTKISAPAGELVLSCEDVLQRCGSSSVDRASAFQAEGREFEPRLPL